MSDIHGKRLRHNRKRKIHSKTNLKTYSKTEKEKIENMETREMHLQRQIERNTIFKDLSI